MTELLNHGDDGVGDASTISVLACTESEL